MQEMAFQTLDFKISGHPIKCGPSFHRHWNGLNSVLSLMCLNAYTGCSVYISFQISRFTLTISILCTNLTDGEADK